MQLLLGGDQKRTCVGIGGNLDMLMDKLEPLVDPIEGSGRVLAIVATNKSNFLIIELIFRKLSNLNSSETRRFLQGRGQVLFSFLFWKKEVSVCSLHRQSARCKIAQHIASCEQWPCLKAMEI